MNKIPTILGTFRLKVNYSLSENDISKAFELLNLYHFNDTKCNKMENGRLVAKYPEKETPEVKDSYHQVRRSVNDYIIVEFLSDGTIANPTFE